ncbi:hypothetical protein [Streptomyces sp. Ru87]|uniref:hypothetical protein n=1 Tax=Streptomyces sp. Ru87 TaxID=2044307 RepID=UPI000BF45B1F|nr:hypothetical protein [Streptomyces sp. Ru87]PGH52205.1 hypothetical protein CRI70_02705 [Streptomyces sp. Ru87]
MRSRRTATTVTALTALAVGAASVLMSPAASAATGAATCTPTTLPLPAGTDSGNVDAADSQGGYAGEASSGSSADGTRENRVVRWKDGRAIDYGRLLEPSASITVNGVNRDGTVVGYSVGAENIGRAFRSRDGKLERLPLPAGARSSFATGINDTGDIVGWTRTAEEDSPHTAVLWPADAPGTAVKLSGGLPTAGHTEAAGIDQDGTVLVNHYPEGAPVSSTAVYLWRSGSARKLAVPPGTAKAHGGAISNGRVAGMAGGTSGAVWDKDGSMMVVPNSGSLHSINSTGQSVGYEPWNWGAVLYGVWRMDTQIATLGNRVGVYVSADNGSVAGYIQNTTTGKLSPTTWRCG